VRRPAADVTGLGCSAAAPVHDGRALREPVAGSDRYEIAASSAAEDREWDAFLAASGAHHAQTSLWRRVKDASGWRGVRLVVRSGGEIAAGVQIYVRRIGPLGAVAYAPKGPVFSDLEGAGMEALVESVQRAMNALRVRYLLFEPSAHSVDLERSLVARSFAPAAMSVEPRATLLLRLGADEDQLLRGMKPRTRYNIRLAARKGIDVREGSEDDLPAFYRLLEATGRRQGFRIYSEDYFRHLWGVLGAKGNAKLFVASHAGIPVSVQLAIAFGTTVTNKLTVWSGEHADRKPNEAVHWAAIRWAGAAGYSLYDFEGIDVSVARALLDGQVLAGDAIPSVTAFKLGFGAGVHLEPQAYERVDGRLLRLVYENAFARVMARRPLVRQTLSALRTRPRRSRR
jgi:peptidoglycan pentaglycine glycine transferase (the first glycine)